MHSVPQFKNGERDLWLCTFSVESPLIEHIQHSTGPPATPPDTYPGEWKSSVQNFCPAFFLPTTPFNRQCRNVCSSENSGTVPGPRLFAQLWVYFLQLWPLPWADTVTCIRWGCRLERRRNMHEACVKCFWDKKVDKAWQGFPPVQFSMAKKMCFRKSRMAVD